ncbi:FHA domain-containing protein, partial [Vibrio vulnificus]
MKFGRSESCDWVLPDPERIISGVHGEITKFGNDYLLRDLSTNGIFVNKSVSPVGNGVEVALSDKDIINFGEYE